MFVLILLVLCKDTVPVAGQKMVPTATSTLRQRQIGVKQKQDVREKEVDLFQFILLRKTSLFIN